jgi:hypothetical protein
MGVPSRVPTSPHQGMRPRTAGVRGFGYGASLTGMNTIGHGLARCVLLPANVLVVKGRRLFADAPPLKRRAMAPTHWLSGASLVGKQGAIVGAMFTNAQTPCPMRPKFDAACRAHETGWWTFPRSAAMAEPNPDSWALSHMRWLALSRWDNEGGASPSRHTEGSAVPPPRHEVRSTSGPVLRWPALEAPVPSTGPVSGRLAHATNIAWPGCGPLNTGAPGR